MEAPKTLQEAIIYFSDFDRCRQFVTELRWPDAKVRCPYCNSEKVTYLESAKLYKCYGDHPKPKFSLKVGTIMEDSPLGLDKWLTAMWLIVSCKKRYLQLRDRTRFGNPPEICLALGSPYSVRSASRIVR
jgi:hypothetical protein